MFASSMEVQTLKYRSENLRLHFLLLIFCLVSPFKSRYSWNRATSCLVFILAFSFSCPSMNSSTDEFKLWKWLVWFEAISPKKNAPKKCALEICHLSVKRSGKRATWFCSPVKIMIKPIRASIRRFSPKKKSYKQSAGFSSAKRPFLSQCFLARKSRYVDNKFLYSPTH